MDYTVILSDILFNLKVLNCSLLFIIGCTVAILVIYILYSFLIKCISKF